MGFHLAVVSLQVPVEAHGEGHAQYIQVTLFSLIEGLSFSLFFFFAFNLYYILLTIQCCWVSS